MRKVLLGFVVLMMAGVLIGQAGEGWVGWKDTGRIAFTSNDEQFETMFDVRMFIQGGYFWDDPEEVMSNSTHLRKGRFAMKVKMWDYWRAEWDMDIADDVLEIKDMWIAYTGMNNAFLKLGNYKVPFGLEILTSSRYISFIERAYPSLAFKMGRRMGLGYTKWGNIWNLNLDVFGQGFYMGDRKDQHDEIGGGWAFRVAAAPTVGPVMVHGGLSHVSYLPSLDETAYTTEFKAEPENKLGDSEHINAGEIRNARRVVQTGLEAAVKLNNFCVQGEVMMADVDRFGSYNDTPYNDASFSGGYAFFSWILTGEERPWDNTQGEFGQVIPNSNKLGAWEVLFRYSFLDLSDPDATDFGNPAGILGGKANNFTFGLTWYANPNVKFMGNFIMTDNSVNATGEVDGGDYDFNSLLLQALINF